MLTIRQIERLWESKDFPRLARELLAGRVESSPQLVLLASQAPACTALALIRLDELGAASHPLAQKLIHSLLRTQNGDGSFSVLQLAGAPSGPDLVVTALAARALAISNGQGPAVDRAVAYLLDLQKDDGTFPRIPIRRTEADAFTTQQVRLHLANVPQAKQRLRPTEAAAPHGRPAQHTLKAPTANRFRDQAARPGHVVRRPAPSEVSTGLPLDSVGSPLDSASAPKAASEPKVTGNHPMPLFPTAA